MSTGDNRSPISLDSDSEHSQGVHPIDAVIQQAIYRSQTPTPPGRSNVNVKSGKRKRDPTPPDADVISLHSSSSDEASHDSDREQAENKTSIASGVGKPALVAPIGVTVVEEGAQTRNPEVQRLLRGGRYFDANVQELGPVCFHCGLRGHKAKDCTNQRKELPCALCAQYGHNKSHCPSLLCYKCQKRGHIARECPNAGMAVDDTRKVCLRCGKSSCAAAGTQDYLRAEGGCSEPYLSADLALVRCYTCNRMGHLCCKEGPQEPPEPSCHNCGDAGHTAVDCRMTKPQKVNMERQFEGRQGGYGQASQYGAGRMQDRWSGRAGPARGYDRFANGGAYAGVHTGASMAVGNGYASRVNALHDRTRGGRDDYVTPRATGNRHYPGSEKIHGPQYDRFDRADGYHDPAAYTAPIARWRR
ncbi:TPA: hypothetical protein ACH3X2_009108 [Trebouxia sp. C0005]